MHGGGGGYGIQEGGEGKRESLSFREDLCCAEVIYTTLTLHFCSLQINLS